MCQESLFCSASLIAFFDGLIEAHFHFFIVVAVVSLYQSWGPYLLAIGYVLAHHLGLGTWMPHLVYNHHMAVHNPWLFALVHGGAVVAESAACLIFWRVTEDALDAERANREALERTNGELATANAAVADLVAMLSHDLRTPLTVLLRMSRVPWNFGGGPVSIRLRSRRECCSRHRQSRRRRAVRARYVGPVGGGGRSRVGTGWTPRASRRRTTAAPSARRATA